MNNRHTHTFTQTHTHTQTHAQRHTQPSSKIPIQPVVVSVWGTKQSALLVQCRDAKTPLIIGIDGPTTLATLPNTGHIWDYGLHHQYRVMTCMQLAL